MWFVNLRKIIIQNNSFVVIKNLADPRLTAFVTHGGLGSVTELAYQGKPAVIVGHTPHTLLWKPPMLETCTVLPDPRYCGSAKKCPYASKARWRDRLR